MDQAGLPRDRLVEIAVAGRSNVGKSSLLNRLVNQRGLAKTSREPGKTRCLNFFLVRPDQGNAFYLVDLPGYGFAKVSHKMRDEWATLIEGYLAQAQRPAGLIALFDARREPTETDQEWLAWLAEWQRPFLTVLTKWDKLSKSEQRLMMDRWREALPEGCGDVVAASAVSGEGILRLWQWIETVRRSRHS